jgi:hypothetical protein
VRGGQGRENETGLTNTQNSAEVGFSRLGRPTKHTLRRQYASNSLNTSPRNSLKGYVGARNSPNGERSFGPAHLFRGVRGTSVRAAEGGGEAPRDEELLAQHGKLPIAMRPKNR